MQTVNEERRAATVRRVQLETLVEICGKDPDLPAFEAESIEVSGRGMQIRTRFLPELHTPLVMRFEHEGREVLVEGQVAWRQGDDEGGQFGVKFTALDSNSVSALKALCQLGGRAPAPSDTAHDEDEDQDYLSERGAPVKLHIHGLGAPMKARVCRGTPRKIEVGSQLEFLKVGKELELEDVGAGQRHAAHIDSVSVAIDPETQTPQLIVSLRYEGADETPEPTVTRRNEAYDDEAYDDEEDELSEDLFKGKVGTMASNAGRAMKDASAQVAQWSAGTVASVGKLLRSTAERSSKAMAERSHTASRTPRKTSRLPQTNSVRRQSRRPETTRRGARDAHTASAELTPVWRRPKVWMFGGALTLSALGVRALLSDDPAAFSDASLDESSFVAAAPQAGVAPSQLPPDVAAAPAPTLPKGAMPPGSQEPVAPGTFPPRAALSVQEQLQPDPHGVVAQVPLFGAKTMATTEPAPANPSPMAAIDEYSLSKDQAFDDAPEAAPPVRRREALEQAATAVPATPAPSTPASESSSVFQVGRMHLPVVHRLRLDAPGAVLQGDKTSSGFSVLIPGRKVMETGTGIAKRDDRIIDVDVKNTPAGGKVTFRFRKDIPGYKVRLRNDYVEFFVNSPK